MITCGDHGWVRGYIVCVHVLAGAPAVHRTEATDAHGVEGLGEALCLTCVGRPESQVKLDDLKLICGNCLALVLGQNRPH